MAIAAGTVFQIWGDGSDNNGGGYVAGGTGTNRSRQSAAQVVIDNSVITASITTTTITFTGGYTPSSVDKDNIVQMLTGTNVTPGFYQITNTGATTWTMDRNVVTSGTTTDATGNMGGALLSPGKAAGAKVQGNTIWLKYFASSYLITSATANVSGGKIDINATQIRFEGYYQVEGDLSDEATYGDQSNFRPTIRASVNSITMFNESSGTGIYGCFQLDATAATSITPITTGSGTTTHRIRVLGGSTTACINASSGSLLLLCGVEGGSAAAFRLNGACCLGCTVYNNSSFAFESASNMNTCVECIASSGTGNGPAFSNTGITARLWCVNCTVYGYQGGTSAHGYSNPDGLHAMAQINCIADTCRGDGVGASNLTHAFNCISRNNTGSNYGTNCLQFGSITPTAAVLNSPSTGDLSLNAQAGGGLVARAAGLPHVFPNGIAATGYVDIGAVQVQSATSIVNSINAILCLPKEFIPA